MFDLDKLRKRKEFNTLRRQSENILSKRLDLIEQLLMRLMEEQFDPEELDQLDDQLEEGRELFNSQRLKSEQSQHERFNLIEEEFKKVEYVPEGEDPATVPGSAMKMGEKISGGSG